MFEEAEKEFGKEFDEFTETWSNVPKDVWRFLSSIIPHKVELGLTEKADVSLAKWFAKVNE